MSIVLLGRFFDAPPDAATCSSCLLRLCRVSPPLDLHIFAHLSQGKHLVPSTYFKHLKEKLVNRSRLKFVSKYLSLPQLLRLSAQDQIPKCFLRALPETLETRQKSLHLQITVHCHLNR